MKKFKSISIMILATACLILSIVTNNRNKTKELGSIQLANIEALTQNSPESYTLSDCYQDITFNKKSLHNITKCSSGTTTSTIYNCSDGTTDKGYSTNKVYQCVK